MLLSIPNNLGEKFVNTFSDENILSRKISEGIIFHARNFMDEVDIPFETNM